MPRSRDKRPFDLKGVPADLIKDYLMGTVQEIKKAGTIGSADRKLYEYRNLFRDIVEFNRRLKLMTVTQTDGDY